MELINNTIISKLIDQNMHLILQCGEEAKLAVYHTKLMQTEWREPDSLSIDIKGLNMDTVWNNIVAQVGGFTIEQGNTLDEQIAIEERRAKLQRELDRLTRQAKSERQPKKKFELVQRIKGLQKETVEI